MSASYVLIGLGLVALGWWIVRSVMDPGIDPPAEGPRTSPPRKPQQRPGQKRGAPVTRGPGPPVRDADALRAWYLVLDVSQEASAAEIRAAVKRRLAQAEASGDRAAAATIARAAAQASQRRRRSGGAKPSYQ
jgi:hypothetical protein